jgi:nucleoid-associated protein YgaU
MFSRYDGRQIIVNDAGIYKNYFRERNVNFFKQYNTPTLRYPTQEEIADFSIISHIWGIGSALWKLASIHYGDPVLWWVIAFYNNIMNEVEFKVGQNIYIPLPLEKVLKAYGL